MLMLDTLRRRLLLVGGTALLGILTACGGTADVNEIAPPAPPAQTAPAFTTQPASVTVTAPAAATFSVAVSGNPTPTLQWQVSTDAGATWTNVAGATAATLTISPTSVGQSNYRYRAVAANSAGSVTSSVATLTVNAAAPGVPWTQVGVPALQRALTSVAFAGPSVAVALGTDGRYIRSTDGGLTWMQSGGPLASNQEGSVAFADANVGVIVARASNGGGVYRTTNAGASWSFVFNLGAVRPNAVAFGSPTVGVTVGDSAAILRTVDGGLNWSAATISAGVGLTDFTGVAFADANTVIVVGGGQLRRSTDGGLTFGAVTTPPGAASRVAFGSAQNGVVVGTGAQVFWTADGGQNWTAGTGAALSTVTGFRGVAFLDANTAIAVGLGAGRGVILRSADGGRTWASVDAGITGVLQNNAVAFGTSTTGVVTGDNGSVLRTTTGGL